MGYDFLKNDSLIFFWPFTEKVCDFWWKNEKMILGYFPVSDLNKNRRIRKSIKQRKKLIFLFLTSLLDQKIGKKKKENHKKTFW